MGQGLNIYPLPEKTIRSLPGSGDRKLLADILRFQGERLSEFDEHAEDQFDDGLPLTMEEAITGLFSGELDPDYPFYGIAFEFVCSSLGEWLNNAGFVPCSVDLYPQLDMLLVNHKVPLKMTDLIHNEPIALPDWDDLLCGHWSPAEIHRAEPALAAALTVEKNEPYLEVIHGWLQHAIQKPGTMLVGCHS